MEPYVVRVWYNIHIDACPPFIGTTDAIENVVTKLENPSVKNIFSVSDPDTDRYFPAVWTASFAVSAKCNGASVYSFICVIASVIPYL